MNKIKNATLALGNFDGVHLGHRKMIQQAIDISDKQNVYVCSFEPHPLQILVENPPKIITPLNQKIYLIENDLGVSYYHLDFNMDIAKLSGEEFIQMLLNDFEIDNIVVGANYYFGNKAHYSTDDLKRLGEKYSFNVYVVDELKINGDVVSSTRIRQFLSEGNIESANELLGREFCIRGICYKGRGIGKSIGFATANLRSYSKNQYPKQGVYATRTTLDGVKHASITNVGYNPTVTSEKQRMIETHIFGITEELYGREICVEFVHRIRDEKKFDTLEELKKQIEQDAETAKEILN